MYHNYSNISSPVDCCHDAFLRRCSDGHSADATQNDGRCEVVPRLPRETKVDVTKCHACHAEVARRHGRHARLNQVQARHPVP